MRRIKQIAAFGKKLMASEDVESTLELISGEAKTLLDAERCSIFIVDKEDKMLWTKISDGIGRIVISLDAGIVGETYMQQKPQVVNSPYDNTKFLPSIDKKSGYVTKNLITVPIFDSKREVIGVIQLLNKYRFDFDDKDLENLTFFANYVSGSLELALSAEL
ncbi:MAG: GAF domain-containing protein [Epsilonproteobacteria bacterium]|nr:GAF domain-containing protein [Campylobacterota bacterium]OIO13833.1 MAG: guanylate cyclase [Helicobacteraceae bacterium CG1_02_36_14]PIP11482.1 MAG: guanylate cyclase [Sulfurimonas sp. CG23_combo_of_CG06-09_8_20_14_all_36_33]PIS25101.1 MAG: GAF domain-containing protein [Sulfurimonas sp. CG08_land_8_20_14_0_20_36_33]PIU34642.1 MAG: GAF domain-containing protein [Sulfurimonas sp. CG07_land_8_20_14_0_80_36_56]PIV04130.1 MAG: GAF domain-containing protein [Sulfurimonas sp. CG03_land_8_20_14_0